MVVEDLYVYLHRYDLYGRAVKAAVICGGYGPTDKALESAVAWKCWDPPHYTIPDEINDRVDDVVREAVYFGVLHAIGNTRLFHEIT